jgi:hypothetical protein
MKLTNQSIGFLTALLKELEEAFPDTIPINQPTTLEEFRKLQGHQEVIQLIKNIRDADKETVDVED